MTFYDIYEEFSSLLYIDLHRGLITALFFYANFLWRYKKMAKANIAGLSTLGVTFSYGVGSVKPSTFSLLNRINALGGISITPETIDASALEDLVERSIAGRASTGGSFPVTINATPETIAEWKAVIAAYKALETGERMWFQVTIPGFTESFFAVAQPPQILPMPSIDQNSLLTMEIPLTIEEYVSLDTPVTAE